MAMPNSLHVKLVIFLLLIYGVSAGTYLVFSRHAYETHQQEIIQKYNWQLAEHLVAESNGSNGLNQEALFQHCLIMKKLIKDRDYYFLDAQGVIENSTTASGALLLHRVDMRPIQEFLGPMPMLPIYGNDPTDPGRKAVFSAAPLGRASNGYLYIVLSGPEYESSLVMARNSYTLGTSLWFGLGGLLLALTTGFLAFVFTTRRIVILSRKLEAFRRDIIPAAASPLAEARKGDEIERLEVAFDDLKQRIGDQLLAIQQADSYRKELIANVSHDLRTPIATLQGYLETILLRGQNMVPEEQRNFVEIAFHQSERLSKLIADLFELSKLDSTAPSLHFEPFSIAELVQDIAQKFSLKASQQGVQLDTVFAFDIPMVSGDIRLIERVLENLIENALRHTPSGGRITLRLTAMKKGVRVAVDDTGSGIALDDLPHIFDRYYRASTKRGDGAGLGLAIAKRVVELHGSHLGVASQPGQGTTFTFDLPSQRYHPASAPWSLSR